MVVHGHDIVPTQAAHTSTSQLKSNVAFVARTGAARGLGFVAMPVKFVFGVARVLWKIQKILKGQLALAKKPFVLSA